MWNLRSKKSGKYPACQTNSVGLASAPEPRARGQKATSISADEHLCGIFNILVYLLIYRSALVPPSPLMTYLKFHQQYRAMDQQYIIIIGV